MNSIFLTAGIIFLVGLVRVLQEAIDEAADKICKALKDTHEA